jgi:hypothetical protein
MDGGRGRVAKCGLACQFSREFTVMRTALIVLLQVVVAFFMAGALMPVLVLTFTKSQNPGVGPWLALGLMAAIFVVLRLVWPRPQR